MVTPPHCPLPHHPSSDDVIHLIDFNYIFEFITTVAAAAATPTAVANNTKFISY